MTDPPANEEFAQPLDDHPEHAETAAGEQATAQDVDALSEAPAALLDAKAAIEDRLTRNVSVAVSALSADEFVGTGNIQGVGVGLGDPTRPGAGPPASPTLLVYVAEPLAVDEMRSLVADSFGVGASADVFPIDVVVTGVIEAQPHRFRARPSPGGISVGHVNITAGTQGCLAVGRSAPRDGRLLMLSNNHVLADSNNGKYGDCVSQAGKSDGGNCPSDRVAILERFVPINFSGPNYVDCATGWCWPNLVRRELVYLSGGSPQYFRIGNTPLPPAVGMTVGKSGRTTQLTRGRITGVGATINVNYNGRVAQFRDQMSVRAFSGNFSQGGDSGSVIWQWAKGMQPVGLLFAGGGGTTFANRIDHVLTALDINLYT